VAVTIISVRCQDMHQIGLRLYPSALHQVQYLQLILHFDTLYSGHSNIFKHTLNEYKLFYVSVLQDVPLLHLPNPTQHFQHLG